MVALVLHHSYGLHWPLLRVVFNTLWGVYLAEAPPVDWMPPPMPEEETPSTAEGATVH